ncbi:MAG: hypothetical protein R3B40_29505 [Polyangiales bacterium]
MGLLDSIKGLFQKLDYGNIDPASVDVCWRVDHELEQARYKGEAPLAAALQKHGLTSLDHWEKVKEALIDRHHQNPEFEAAMLRVRQEYQQQLMRGSGPQG